MTFSHSILSLALVSKKANETHQEIPPSRHISFFVGVNEGPPGIPLLLSNHSMSRKELTKGPGSFEGLKTGQNETIVLSFGVRGTFRAVKAVG